ncbi:reverse transcriptase domain-containing protein [Tanacetum coccineum]
MPLITTPVEKRKNNKFCEFLGEVGHNTDECMHLKRKIEELIKVRKLSHVIKELKQGSGKEHLKAAKKGETSRKDKAMAILMVQSWQRVAKQKITQSFSPEPKISFPPLGNEDGTEGPMIIEAEIGGHFIHRMYVDGGRPQKFYINIALTGSVWRIKVAIHPEHLEQTNAIGSTLTEEGQKSLCELLRRNLDIFALKPEDMTGVPRHLAKHHLNVREGCSSARQKKRSQAPERNKAIQKEVAKLVDAGIMKEVNYHSCLSNPVMVKKHDDSWRMCVDFKDLNKACPKNGYSLPKIDWKLLSRPKVIERLQKWSIELGEYDIQYRPQTSVKGQILADFIVERPEDDPLDTPMEAEEELPDPWTLFMDESSYVDGSGAGLILTNPEGAKFTYALRFRFNATNNEAEYEALIAGLRIAEQIGIKNLQANVDSRLVANQVNV